MEIKGSEIISEVQETTYQLETSYKEPVLTISLNGETLATITLKVASVASVSGASDILDVGVTLEDYQGVRDAIVRQLHLPSFKAHVDQVKAEQAAQVEAEKAAQAESEPVVETVEAEPEKE